MENNKLVEAFSIRYGWSDEAILSITAVDIHKMTMEELLIYSDRMEELVPDGYLTFHHMDQDAEGNPMVKSLEDWDG